MLKDKIDKLFEADFDEGDMTPQEVREDTIKALINLRKSVNRWDARDTLKELTKFGFWRKGQMLSIDIEMAKDIASEALAAVKESMTSDFVNKIYDKVYAWANHKE